MQTYPTPRPAGLLRNDWKFFRAVFYIHLAGVAYNGACAYGAMIRGPFAPNPPAPEAIVILSVAPALLFFACPLVFLVAMARSDIEPEKKLGLLFLEGLLTIVHFYVFYVAIQL